MTFHASHNRQQNCLTHYMEIKTSIKMLCTVLVLFLALFLMMNCTTVKTIQLTLAQKTAAEQISTTPVNPDDVKIYRSTTIDDPNYRETAMVVLSTSILELPAIYSRLRKEAAQKGAHYIVNFKLQSKVKETMHIGDDGAVSNDEKRHYTASGTLLSPIVESSPESSSESSSKQQQKQSGSKKE